MSDPAARLVTAEEFLAMPEDDKKTELIAGVIHETSSARPRHGRVQGTLMHRLGGPFDQDDDGPGGWWILPEVGIRLTRWDVPVPDLSGWRRERLPAFPEEGVAVEVVPDWVCEVLSPTTARLDRIVKTELYLAHGVPFLWMVDPVLRTAEAYRNHDGRWLLLGAWTDGASVGIPPFDAVSIDVGRLFLPKGPDVAAEPEPAPWGP